MEEKLTTEEREILEAFEQGRLERSKDAEAIQRRHREYAEGMLKKTRGSASGFTRKI